MINYSATAYGLRTGDAIDCLEFCAPSDADAVQRACEWLGALGAEYRLELEREDHTPIADLHP